jgi:hypothetical protein
MGVGVCCTKEVTRSVGSDRNQTEIKRSAELTDLLEGRTDGEIVLWIPVVFSFR